MSDAPFPPDRWNLQTVLLRVILTSATCLTLAVPGPGAELLWRSPNNYRLLLKVDNVTLRFFERDYIEDCTNDTHPIVKVEGFQRARPSLLDVVRRYADAMIEHGRDTYGRQKTGLLLSALDRETLSPLETRPPAPEGVSRGSRPGPAGKPLVGSNLQMDQNLLRLLYFLKGLSGEDRYPEAADAALKWFLRSAQSPNTGLLQNHLSNTYSAGPKRPIDLTDGFCHDSTRPFPAFVSKNLCRTGGDNPTHRRFAPRAIE